MWLLSKDLIAMMCQVSNKNLFSLLSAAYMNGSLFCPCMIIMVVLYYQCNEYCAYCSCFSCCPYTVNASAISSNLNCIPVLNGSNFLKWKEHVNIVFGCMDLDYALRVDEPPKPNEFSTTNQKANYEKWERSNRMSLMIMKHSISNFIRGAMLEE